MKRQRGTTLIETMIATAMCMVVVFALAGLVAMSTKQSKEMGTTVSQATALAAQQVDLLLGLAWTAAAMDTRLTAGGSLSCVLSSCNASYIDFLDANGLVLTGVTPSNAASNPAVFFIRRWEIANTTSTLKGLRVRVEGKAVGRDISPSSTLATYKAQQ